MQFLAKDLKIATDAVKQYVKVPITSNQFAALASFAFNVGNGALKDSTLLKMLNAGKVKGVFTTHVVLLKVLHEYAFLFMFVSCMY